MVSSDPDLSRRAIAPNLRAHDVRNRLVQLATLVAVAVLAAGCGGIASAADPYEVLSASTKAAWNPIQVNVGLTVTVNGTTISLDPSDMAFVLDTTAGKGAVHISLPAAGLGLPAGALDSLGIDGDSLDFDVVYAGDALYARSALLKPSLTLILGPTGKLPAGDLTGWLKLGTAEELAALAALSGGMAATPSAVPSLSGQLVKQEFEAVGISLTSAGTEKRNGVDAHHITVAIDTAKMLANPSFAAGAGPEFNQVAATLNAVTLSGDLWVDQATSRIIEGGIHVVSTANTAQVGDVKVTVRDPDGSVSLDAPTSSVEVPLGTLMSEAMKLLGRGAES
jgi:uncharacterized glyoxalase superfamily protein PhnB